MFFLIYFLLYHYGLIAFFFFLVGFNMYLFIYLAALGMSCAIWHLVP